MTTIHLRQTTTVTPEQFLAGLTDFGPGRSKIFPNSADGYLKVHDLGPSQADVTEGSVGIWERLHYDWSDPHRITMTTTATPEQFLAALTDFGPGRSKIFPNSADGYLEVHDQGPGYADVTEGSNGVWERLRYD